MELFDKHIEKITKLFNSIKKNDEFELDMDKTKTALTYNMYYKLLKFLAVMSKKYNYVTTQTYALDVNYTMMLNSNRTVYRISINGDATINQTISKFRESNNNTIFSILLEDYKNNKPFIEVYKKERNIERDIIDIDDLNVRIRKTSETKLTSNDIKNIEKFAPYNDIKFRLKERLSIILNETKDYKIVIDLTKINTSDKLTKLDGLDVYELEIEYFSKTGKLDTKSLNIILNQCILIMKTLQSSNYIITVTEKKEIIDNYYQLIDQRRKKNQLSSKNVTSIELQHLNILPNKYAVTDKADGDHGFIFITNKNTYILTQNLDVIKTGITISDFKYDNSILDGELIFIKKENRFIFMVFDCLYYCNEDSRAKGSLLDRLKLAEDVIKHCFVFGKQLFKENNYNTQIKTTDIVKNNLKFYENALVDYFEQLNNDIKLEKKFVLIRPKYFIFPLGIEDNEIYKYSELFWTLYSQKLINYPYNLDGLVYQPINQKYDITNTTYPDLKWKPEENNSIDFYIEFQRDNRTGKVLTVFDNVDNQVYDETDQPIISDDKTILNLYRICHLHVGQGEIKTSNTLTDVIKNKEIPVIFSPDINNPNKNVHIANLPIIKSQNNSVGIIKDIEGNIIQDKTVVEFYYKNDLSIDSKYRWVPMRTRFDKTEQVHKYQRKYGNNEQVANHIWFSIQYPITFNDIKILADSNQYTAHKIVLLQKLTPELISQTTSYYEKHNKLIEMNTKPQTDFHNAVKTLLINTYIKPEFNNNKKASVLDIGFGRGGDIMKYYNAEVKNLVGIDKDFDGLHNPGDGAFSRYEKYKRGKPNFPQMDFINADFTVLLNFNDQMQVIKDKTQTNMNLIKKYFDGKYKFDIISCQFAFHYFLQNKETWENTLKNINNHLKFDGILLFTSFDAKRVTKLLRDNKGTFKQFLTINGEKILYHDIVQKYEEQKIYKYGNSIDIHISRFMSDNIYQTEYLVDENFIIPELFNKCGLQLIETDYFEYMFHNLKEYVKDVSEIENKDNMRQFLIKILKYFEETDINKECQKITFLNRYYVFKKIK